MQVSEHTKHGNQNLWYVLNVVSSKALETTEVASRHDHGCGLEILRGMNEAAATVAAASCDVAVGATGREIGSSATGAGALTFALVAGSTGSATVSWESADRTALLWGTTVPPVGMKIKRNALSHWGC